MIRPARLDNGKVTHLTRFVGDGWRSVCWRAKFTWQNGDISGEATRYGSTPQPATLDTIDRPICSLCIAAHEAETTQVAAWIAEHGTSR